MSAFARLLAAKQQGLPAKPKPPTRLAETAVLNDGEDIEARIQSMQKSANVHVRTAGACLRAHRKATGENQTDDYIFPEGPLPKTVGGHDPRDVARAVLDAAAKAKGEWR
jgi:hypothetical protein